MSERILNLILDELRLVKTDITSLKQTVLENGQKLNRLESDVGVLKLEVSVLKSDVSVLKSDVGVLKSDVSVLKTDVGVLKSDVSVLKSDVSVLKSDVSVLKTDVAVLTTDMQQVKQAALETHQDIKQIQKMQISLTQTIGEHDVSIRTLLRGTV